jgi:ClpP class serine protease
MWLLEPITKKIIEIAETNAQISAEDRGAFNTRLEAESKDGSRILAGNGRIHIKGVLTNEPNIFAMFFGGGNTTYPEIIGAIAEAEADPNVSEIQLIVNTTGGGFDGLYACAEAIKATSKPITAVVTGSALSAGYWLVSMADKIVAENKSSTFGSIGVARRYQVSEGLIDIASSKAPKKRPDVTTPKGVAMVQEELDPIHEMFAGAVAEGRGTNIDNVNKKFGEGATLLAEDALDRGMIDSIGASAKPEPTGLQQEDKDMLTLEVLKTENVALYNSIVADAKADGKAEGVLEGIEQERTRVASHIALSDDSGDIQTALDAIKGTEGITPAIQTAHVQATIKKLAVIDRLDDDALPALAGNADLSTADATADNESKLMDTLESIMGIEGTA